MQAHLLVVHVTFSSSSSSSVQAQFRPHPGARPSVQNAPLCIATELLGWAWQGRAGVGSLPTPTPTQPPGTYVRGAAAADQARSLARCRSKKRNYSFEGYLEQTDVRTDADERTVGRTPPPPHGHTLDTPVYEFKFQERCVRVIRGV